MLDRTSVDTILNEMNYHPDRWNSVIKLDGIEFDVLARAAHDMDITVNAMINALLYIHIEELRDNIPNIPGVGTAPYMEDYWSIDFTTKK